MSSNVGHAVDQLAQVLLLHDELEELDLQGGGPTQGVHVSRRRLVGAARRALDAAQRGRAPLRWRGAPGFAA